MDVVRRRGAARDRRRDHRPAERTGQRARGRPGRARRRSTPHGMSLRPRGAAAGCLHVDASSWLGL